jgi:hypothetical protein
MPPVAARARFDVVWFGQQKALLKQSVFDRLNGLDAEGRGHYFVMPTTMHADEIRPVGNRLAFYYRTLNADDQKQMKWPRFSAQEIVDEIVQKHTEEGFTTKWIFVNEISAALWPAQREYRQWVIDIAQQMSGEGYRLAFFSPFATLRPNRPAGPDWKTLSDHAWIVIEGYLSGQEILTSKQNGDQLAWCQAQYEAMKDSYTQYGVPGNRIFLVEHFGHTRQGKLRKWGRCGVSMDDWLTAIRVRSAAAKAVQFGGFVSFAWMYNQMNASESDLLRCCDAYLAANLP